MASDGEVGEQSRPRVCVIAAHFVQHGGMWLGGGAEKYLLATIEGLLDAGVAVRVGYCGDDLYADARARRPAWQFSTERLDWVNDRLSGDRRITRPLVRDRRQWFEAHSTDVAFFVQQAHGTAFGAAVVGARLAGARVVMSVRQPPAPFPAPTGKRYWGVLPSLELWRRQLRWRSQRVARSCHAILFNCNAVRDAFVAQWGWPKLKCHVVPNGIERRPARRELVHGVLRFGCVGQVAAHKGADVVVEAARRLAATGEAFELAFFGDGGLTSQLRSASAGLPIRYHPFAHDVEQAFSQIDVLVAASRRESSSNAVLEAMARGIPCIVSDAGGLPELVDGGRAGLVVEAGDSESLSGSMLRLLRDPDLRRRLGLAGLARARREHDVQICRRETMGVILGKAGIRRIERGEVRDPLAV